jgi:hypothetical protein
MRDSCPCFCCIWASLLNSNDDELGSGAVGLRAILVGLEPSQASLSYRFVGEQAVSALTGRGEETKLHSTETCGVVMVRERSPRGERFKSEDATYNDKENKLE